MAQPKATEAQMEQRITEIYKLLLQDAPRADILQFTATQWQASERTTDEYIARARALLNNHTAAQRDYYLGLTIARMNEIFGQALQARDYKNAIRASAELCRVLGLYAPTQTQHGGLDGNPVTIKLIRASNYDTPPRLLDWSDEDERMTDATP